MNLEPVIKWSGSKRSQANSILNYILKSRDSYDTYYELFCGGCSILYAILNTPPLCNKFKRFVCNDINKDLISVYQLVKSDYKDILVSYEKLWNELNKNSDINRKREFFTEIRDKYNKTQDPRLFFFLMRIVTNGMPRYNSKGEFNSSFHFTRNGILPKKLENILKSWNYFLNLYKVEFYSEDYSYFKGGTNKDLFYLDPPYFNTKGMYYYKSIDYKGFWKWLGDLNSNWLLSFDGKAGTEDNTYQEMPESILNICEHKYIDSGNSSFRRILGKSKDTVVQESLYIHVHS